MHLYDDFTKPLTLSQARKISGDADVVEGRQDGQGDDAIPLVRSGRYLQASIGKQPFPAQMYAKREVQAGRHATTASTSRFDAYSKEPHSASAADDDQRDAGDRSPAVDDAGARHAADACARSVRTSIRRSMPLPIPDTVPRSSRSSRTRTDQIRAVHRQGRVRRDLRAGVSGRRTSRSRSTSTRSELPAERQQGRRAGDRASSCASAYLLDAFGDLGNKQQISEAYASLFVEAVKDIRVRLPATAAADDGTAMSTERIRLRLHWLAVAVAAVALDDPAGRGAQGDHLEIHLQRRRVPDPARSMRALPRRRRHRADVADDLRRCVSVGGIDSRGAGRDAHAAVERGGRLRRAQARAHADAEASWTSS